jgi:hypothetical protein
MMSKRSKVPALMLALGIVAMTGVSASAQGFGDILKEKGKSAIPSGSTSPSVPSTMPSAAPSIPNVGGGLSSGALDSLKGQLSLKDGLIGKLKSQLSSKDGLIGGLKSTLTKKDGLIGGLQKTLTDKESELRALQDKLAAGTGLSANTDDIKAKLSAAQDAVKAKESAERSLKAKMEELSQQNAALSKQLGSRQSAAASIKAEVADLKSAAVKATAERDIALVQTDTLETHRLILGVLLILALLGLGILAMRRPKAA